MSKVIERPIGIKNVTLELTVTIIETLEQYKNVLASNLGCKVIELVRSVNIDTFIPEVVLCVYSKKSTISEFYKISLEIIGNQNNDFPYTINEHDVIVKKEA